MTNQRMKWDAEAAFKKIEATIASGVARDPDGISNHKLRAYKPPSNITPERLAQLRRYEPAAKPHGRDIASLMRYHEAHKKGRTDDDCLAEKFGSVGKMVIPTPGQQPSVGAGSSPAAPTPPQSADGPWPKWAKSGGEWDTVFRYDDPSSGEWFNPPHARWHRRGQINYSMSRNAATAISEPEALQWLEQNGHADVAAQFRGKGTTPPRDDVATGARAWRKREGLFVVVQGEGYVKWCPGQEWSWGVRGDVGYYKTPDLDYTELHGPERDAIVAECRKAMGL